MVGKHILVVGNPTVATSALNMIKELHGTQEVRYEDSVPNDTQMPQPECVVVVEDMRSPIINSLEYVEFEKSYEPRQPMNRKERRHGFVENNEPWRNKRKGG